jgi:hypothetical protein
LTRSRCPRRSSYAVRRVFATSAKSVDGIASGGRVRRSPAGRGPDRVHAPYVQAVYHGGVHNLHSADRRQLSPTDRTRAHLFVHRGQVQLSEAVPVRDKERERERESEWSDGEVTDV